MAGLAPPAIRAKNAQYQANSNKRGQVKTSLVTDRKDKQAPVNPYVVGFLLLVLSGGAIFEVLKVFTATPQSSDYEYDF